VRKPRYDKLGGARAPGFRRDGEDTYFIPRDGIKMSIKLLSLSMSQTWVFVLGQM